jgi:hypothetical protein
VKAHALKFKLFADELIQLDSSHHHIPADKRWRKLAVLRRLAKFLKHLEGEEGDLSFVVGSVIEKAIAPDTVPGDAFDRRHFDCRISIRLAAVMTEEIVPRRDIEVTDFHLYNDTIDRTPVRTPPARRHRI